MSRKPVFVALLILCAIGIGRGGSVAQASVPPDGDGPPYTHQGPVTPADRVAAAQRMAALAGNGDGTSPKAVTGPTTAPDYFGMTPNYANSPLPVVDPVTGAITGGIRKFVDTLPGLGAANQNDLGQYLPVAVPDTTTYPGSDYYEISLVRYTEQLHKDLPPTTLQGYVQTNTTDPSVSKPSYLGPTLMAQEGRPVRIKFTNKLPTGAGGNLFLPVDITTMGAGTGPNGGTELYTQNRATLHLHGGATPWISDGTPSQWTTPAGESTSYPKGVSVQDVPDMWFDPVTHLTVPAGTANATNSPGAGSLTFYYTNQQSARLMFYHDHSYGITRLNVYGGEAAGYILQDQVEGDLVNGTNVSGVNPNLAKIVPADQIPLIIQDKTFVPQPAQLAAEDPTWDTSKWGGYGSLWFPHVYMPNQNPWDNSGVNAMGRWDYGPWFWPPFTGMMNQPKPNPLSGTTPLEGPVNPGTPTPSEVPEAYMDTPLVNGTAYPVLNVDPKAYRFRILNAANDRFWNLQLYQAVSSNPMWSAAGALLDATAGEVAMVPAVATPGFPTTWPTDGRDGGVPNPAAAGPQMIQIGTEGGFLPAPAVIPNQPVNYSYDRRNIVVLNVTDHGLFIGPAERADVIVDFSQYAGKTLILYNDGPAPVPAFDPRDDYYTGDPNQVAEGGAPTTLPGYGPNTRTIMQIKVAANTVSSVSLATSGAGYSRPTAAINGGGGSGATATVTGSVDNLVANVGSGYTTVPTVTIAAPQSGAYSPAATAVATTSVTGINFQAANGGSGYSSAPSVTIGGSPAGTGAVAKATVSVTGITLGAGGTGYTSAPTVTVTDPGGAGTGVTATATVTNGVVTTITFVTAGANYTTPTVSFSGGGGSGATATTTGAVDGVSVTSPGARYVASTVTISGGGGTGATATATGLCDGISLLTAGAGYTSAPAVTLSGGNGTGASATTTLKVSSIALTKGGTNYTSAPTVTISDAGSGTGATATASLVAPVFDSAGLNAVFAGSGKKGVFQADQDPIIVPQAAYSSAYGASFSDVFSRIQNTSLTFTPMGGTSPLTINMAPKAIQELFEADYGRMNATLGVELPMTTMTTQTTIPYGFIDPPTEVVTDNMTPMSPVAGDGTQIWKITHNGVDTHAIHFHLFNVQLINRVGWDGAIRPPEANELGWKETVRMNPLEDAIVALRPVAPTLPFQIPDDIRPMDVTQPLGSTLGFLGVDPNNQPIPIVNSLVNYGWDYVWHCHLLGHEETDMMRPIIFAVAPKAPDQLTASGNADSGVTLRWRDNSANELVFKLQRATDAQFTANLTTFTVPGSTPANTYGETVSYTDTTASAGRLYYYRVIASDTVGYTAAAASAGYPTTTTSSTPSNVAVVGAQLAFVQQPAGAAAGTALSTQPVVAVTDAASNVVTTDQTTQVTLSLLGGAGPLTCTGGLTQLVVNGRAAFQGCTVATAGTYTLQATSVPVLLAVTSSSFTMTVAAAPGTPAPGGGGAAPGGGGAAPGGGGGGAPAPTKPAQQTVLATPTGIYCFAYSGPTVSVSGFGTLFALTVAGVNIQQLPAGNFASWFRPAPLLATVASLTNGQVVCVAAAVGSQVFAP